MQSPLAELRGGSFLSGCRGEASLHSRSRVQPRPVKVMRIVTLYWVLPAAPKEENFIFDHPAVLLEGRFRKKEKREGEIFE